MEPDWSIIQWPDPGGCIVVLSGAGVSAESGIKTFRDHDGLWENYRIEDVCTPQAWANYPQRVQEFYNLRRKQLLETQPNEAHRVLARLQEKYDVQIVTQNIDDLHERAGSNNVLHLHGELRKARSTIDEDLLIDIDGWELRMGERCPKGSQLRPHVVFFGEAVPMIGVASEVVSRADLLLVVGTSLAVYPAAGLIHEVPPGVDTVAIDPGDLDLHHAPHIYHIKEKATVGMQRLAERL